jgi:hypothetical protein
VSNRLLFNREPAVLLGLVSAVVATLVGFNIGLTTETGALILAAVEAAGAVVLAFLAKETLFAAVTQLAKAGLALAVGFGLVLSEQQSLLLVVLAGALVTAFQRTQIHPEAGSPTVA